MSGLHRPVSSDGKPLALRPFHGEPIRWFPRHGEPICVLEWVSQNATRLAAFLPIYIAIIVSIMICIMVFHPWGLGK